VFMKSRKTSVESMGALPAGKSLSFIDLRSAVHNLPVGLPGTRAWLLLLSTIFLVSTSAYGQTFEVTPFVGGTFGGTTKVQQEGVADRALATFNDAFNFGVSAGFRFDADDCESCSLVEFTWIRDKPNLSPKNNALNLGLFQPSITLDNFLGDFTREFPIKDQVRIKPFLTASIGAVHVSAPAESRTKLVLGIGGGVNIFPRPRWGLRLRVEYLPIVLNADVQKLVCATRCVVLVGGGVVNQLTISVGPIFRF
jgi:hypothetical protein